VERRACRLSMKFKCATDDELLEAFILLER
jgi:hypothetical protein